MTKEKAMYQTWLVIENLSEEEKNLIPQEMIEEIKNHMEYDDTIIVDTSIPIEKQKLDEKTWNMLEKIIRAIEKTGHKIGEKTYSQKEFSAEESEIIRLKENIIHLRKENKQLPEAKALTEEYRSLLIQKEAEIEKLKKNNEELYQSIQKIPSFVRKMFGIDWKKLSP